MEQFKSFAFFLDDLSDEERERFIRFLNGDYGNHDVFPFCIYETIGDDIVDAEAV